ncbi:MAG: type II 3-dehydroquinate dehydratase [Desulfovibrionaceae bacterium]
MKISIVNGPNLRFLSEREPNIYGTISMDDMLQQITSFAKKEEIALSLDFFQSNCEGAILDYIEARRCDGTKALILNAGALTHTSLALADCIQWVKLPTVEVHISHIFTREEMRHVSLIAPHCNAFIAGCGIHGYFLAFQFLALTLYTKE